MKNWVLNFVVLQVCLGLLTCVEAGKKKKHDKKVHNLDIETHVKKIDLFHTVTHYANGEFFIDMHKVKSNHHKIHQTDELMKSLAIGSDNQKKTPVSFEKIAAYAKKLLKENQELAKTKKAKLLSKLKEGKKKINRIIKNTKKAKKTNEKKNKESTKSTKSERHSKKDGNVSTDNGGSNELDGVATMFDRADAGAIAADAKKKEATNQNLGEIAPPGTEKPKHLQTSVKKEITPNNTEDFKWGTFADTFPSVQKLTKPLTNSQTEIISMNEKPTI